MPAPTLFCYFARVGDLVMLTPVLRALAAQGPLELCARPWAAGLLAHEPWLTASHALARPNLAGWEDLLTGGKRRRLGRRLAQRGFGRVVIFDREHRHVRRWIAGWRGSAELLELPGSRLPGSLHAVDANIAAAMAAGITVADRAPRLTVPAARLDQARARLAALGRRVIAVQAGSSLTHRWFRRQPNLKGLTPGQWSGLLQRILSDGDGDAVVLLGSAPEGREARAIRAAMREDLRRRVHDWTGEIGLADLPAVLAACRAVVSVDTGPAHIAAAVGTPLITIFGPSDPQRFQPRGPGPIQLLVGSAPCQFCLGEKRFRSCQSNICLNQLTVGDLMNAWSKLDKDRARLQPPSDASLA